MYKGTEWKTTKRLKLLFFFISLPYFCSFFFISNVTQFCGRCRLAKKAFIIKSYKLYCHSSPQQNIKKITEKVKLFFIQNSGKIYFRLFSQPLRMKFRKEKYAANKIVISFYFNFFLSSI